MIRPWLFALMTFAGACSATSSSGARSTDVATLKADLEQGAVPLLVDVRTAGEFESGHVPGARNVPLHELEARVAELGPPDAEVHVICQSGRRSRQASELLAEQGLRPVDVRGGTNAWTTAGYPLERGP